MLRRLLEINIQVISMLRYSDLKLAETQGRSCLQYPFASKSTLGKHNENNGKTREAMTANRVIQGSLTVSYMNLERLKRCDSCSYLKYVIFLVRKERLRDY